MTKTLIVSFLVISFLASGILNAQEAKPAKQAELKVKTSAQCGQCKDRLERAMAFEKGIVSSTLNLEDKVFTIVYKPAKTTPEKIRTAISKTGYDADAVPADTKAYDKLPPCCKKPDGDTPVEHKTE
ncbi:MAG: heavy-metal-associated domain-containing protein [Bacteroidales bacterium]